jgi:hypothetical protein
MKSISDIYRRQWPTMRALRGLGHDTSIGPMFYFCLDVEPHGGLFMATVQDQEVHPEGISGFSVDAHYSEYAENRVFLEDRYQGSGQTL